tara:strand:- start:55 stop:993 length:939 start_codon:yes stop_codon:yes gene_type:complete
MTLISSELFELISEEISSTKHGRILFISPYITTSTLIELAKQISDERHVVVVTSWDEMNLLQGSSNLDLYPFCDSRGWDLKILNNLHAKAYAVEPSVLFIGSANLTRRGLLDKEPTNHELLYKINQPSREDWYRIEEILTKSRTVTEDLFTQYTDWLANQQELPALPPISPFVETGNEQGAWMPLTFSPSDVWVLLQSKHSTKQLVEIAQTDLEHLSVLLSSSQEQFMKDTAKQYFSHSTVKAICDEIGSEWMRFGAIKQIVSELFRETDTDRDTITQYVRAFYQWVEELDKEETFEFGIPRHSQLIRRRQT